MAIKGITVADTIRHVLDEDPCKKKLKVPMATGGFKEIEQIDEGATYFILSPLDVFLMSKVYDEASDMHTGDDGTMVMRTRINETNIKAVRFGLKSWEHFTDTDGNDIPFATEKRLLDGREYQAVTDECLNRIGVRSMRELGDKIKALSEVSKAEEKNSDTASSPSA